MCNILLYHNYWCILLLQLTKMKVILITLHTAGKLVNLLLGMNSLILIYNNTSLMIMFCIIKVPYIKLNK